jgi:hypothetical protein
VAGQAVPLDLVEETMIEAGKSRLFWSPGPVDRDSQFVFDEANDRAKLIGTSGVTDLTEIKGVTIKETVGGFTIKSIESTPTQLGPTVASPTPTDLGLTTAWSAADWREAYNALSWRRDWPAIASFQAVTSGRWHPSSLITLSKAFVRDPAERSLTEILRQRQRRRAVHLEYRRRVRARARRGRR